MPDTDKQLHAGKWERPTSGTIGQMVDVFMSQVSLEYVRAHDKYPAPNPNTSALAGEAGEACEAMGKEPFANVYVECVQTAVMAMRLALEGDPFQDVYRARVGLDLSTSEAEVNALACLNPDGVAELVEAVEQCFLKIPQYLPAGRSMGSIALDNLQTALANVKGGV